MYYVRKRMYYVVRTPSTIRVKYDWYVYYVRTRLMENWEFGRGQRNVRKTDGVNESNSTDRKAFRFSAFEGKAAKIEAFYRPSIDGSIVFVFRPTDVRTEFLSVLSVRTRIVEDVQYK